MADYGINEYLDMVLLYGECRANAAEASREYAIRYPDRRHPDANVIYRLVNRLRGRGSLLPDQKGIAPGRPRTARTPEVEEAVLEAFQEDPTRSLREVAEMNNISYGTTQNIMKSEKMHAYHYTRVQQLKPEDYGKRLSFCRWLLRMHARNPSFVSNILFTDESSFSRDGVFNLHNNHYWSLQNPHVMTTRRFQERFSMNMWTGILGDQLIGPFVLPARLNGESYNNFLQNNLPILMEDVPLGVRETMWFQHDGAPPHNQHEVRGYLNVRFPNRWIGRGGRKLWPPRSPDLTPLDFFLWGHIKTIVYRTSVDSEEELLERILQAMSNVTPEMLAQARQNLLRRAEMCVRMEGGHFEHLL